MGEETNPFQSLLDKPMLLAGAGALLLMMGLFMGAFLLPLLQAMFSSGGKSGKKKKKKRNKSKANLASNNNNDSVKGGDSAQQSSQTNATTVETTEETSAETQQPTSPNKKKKKKKGGAAVAAEAETKPAETPEPETPSEPGAPAAPAVAEETTPAAAATTGKKKKKKKKKAANGAAAAEATAATAKAKTDEDDDDDDDDLAVLLKNRKKPEPQTKSNPNNSVQTASSTAKQQQQQPQKKSREDSWVTVDKRSPKASDEPQPEEEEDEAAAAEPADPNAIHTVNLQVTEAQKPVLLGPKGATIQSIQSECQVKLDLQVPVLKITGTEAAIAQAMEQVSAILEKDSAQKAHSVTLTAKDINGADGVKAIIGKGGATIQSIQSETNCQLDANVEQGKVVITGPTAEQVERASTLCQHAVFGEAQDVMELQTVSTVMLVLGKDFSKIRQLEQEAGEGCKLDIVKGTTTLKIRGPAEAVPKARTLVQGWLDYCSGETLTIEQAQVGAVYGKGGVTIRKIQAETGAFVEILDGNNNNGSAPSSSDKKSGSVPCKIMGEPEAVQQAKAMVLKALDGEMVELQKGEVMELMDLDPYVVPSVIGRGGSKIRELQTQYGVQLQVTGTRLRLIGTKQKVTKAKTELDTKIIQPLMEEKRIAEEAERLEQEASKENGKGGGAWSALPEADDADGW